MKQETYDRVKRAALPGETFSDTIQRLCVLVPRGRKAELNRGTASQLIAQMTIEED